MTSLSSRTCRELPFNFKGDDRDDPEFVHIVNQFFISDERINVIRSETQKDQSL